MALVETCRCKVHPDHPCGAAITAEDLLCDACREAAGGCALIQVNGEWLRCHTGRLEFSWNVVTAFGSYSGGVART